MLYQLSYCRNELADKDNLNFKFTNECGNIYLSVIPVTHIKAAPVKKKNIPNTDAHV